MPRLFGKYKKISSPKPIFEIGSSSANSTPPSKPSSKSTALNRFMQDLSDGKEDIDVPMYFTDNGKPRSMPRSKPPSMPRSKPPSKPRSKPPSTTPLLSSFSPINASSEHLPKMVKEFVYLDTHLKKLKKREEVERFKYYVKKRIYFYLNLLTRSDKSDLNKYSMILIKKIAKKLNSTLTKIYGYIRRQRTETVEKYFERSKFPSKNIRSANFLNNPSSPKEMTVIHLKRYLARIPPKNIQEILAFKDLFQDRMKAEQLETLKKNVKNINNTIADRTGYMAPSMYQRGINEAERHLRTVAGRKIGLELKKKSEKKEKVRQEKLRQSREGRKVKARLEAEAREESATRKRNSANRKRKSANRRKAIADRRRVTLKAAVRLQSMGRMRLGRKERQARTRDIIEKEMVKKAKNNNKYTTNIHGSLERRKKAVEKGLQKQKEREMIKKQEDERRNQTLYENLMKGKPMSPKARQRAVEIAIEAVWKQGPNLPDRASEMAIETELKQGPNRPSRPVVEHVTMPRSPRKPSSKPQIVYVRPNGQYVNAPGFTGSPIGNKKRMVVVRSDPKEDTYLNYLKRLSGDLFGYY